MDLKCNIFDTAVGMNICAPFLAVSSFGVDDSIEVSGKGHVYCHVFLATFHLEMTHFGHFISAVTILFPRFVLQLRSQHWAHLKYKHNVVEGYLNQPKTYLGRLWELTRSTRAFQNLAVWLFEGIFLNCFWFSDLSHFFVANVISNFFQGLMPSCSWTYILWRAESIGTGGAGVWVRRRRRGLVSRYVWKQPVPS